MVAAVRVAMAFPVFCLALPAGVWADRFDRRRWLLCTQSLLVFVGLLMAGITMLGWMSPFLLLVLTAVMGIALILNLPAWQALTPELVPAALIPSAIQAGSVSFNLARAVGPALAGLAIANLGVGAAFLFNALSFSGIMLALVLWQPTALPTKFRRTPSSFKDDLLLGMRIVATSPFIRSTLIRVVAYTFTASALWSLLSLVATDKLDYRERGFGLCLSLLGAGAVASAAILPWIRQRFSSEKIVFVSQLLMALCLAAIAASSSKAVIIPALLMAGVSWMFCLTTLNSTAQVRLPRQFRARGMSAFVMSFSLGMGLGSLVWGALARCIQLEPAFMIAALVSIVLAIATCRLPLGSLAPSDSSMA
jgi:predicted MFS family arabinose efflux permease